MDMTNETVGDAISDLLLVESILHAKGWSVQDWNKKYQARERTIVLDFYGTSADHSFRFLWHVRGP
jgi:hypothetical protein